MRKKHVDDLLSRLAEREQQFLDREFLAPVPRGGEVRVGIAGVVCKVRIEPRDFEGWGVFRPASHSEALLVRPATLAERRRYLDLFPLVRLVVCRRAGNQWLCCTASFGDRRFTIEGLVPIELSEGVQTFDVIQSRYDGGRFWFDEVDMRHDPGMAAYLRTALAQTLPPIELDRPGLTAEERAAYELNYWAIVDPATVGPAAGDQADRSPQQNPLHRRRSRRPLPGAAEQTHDADPVRRRLRENLSHAGANLVDYLEHSDTFRVTYSIGGRQYTSAVDKADLSVQVAGICLSGEDEKFDLASLVGVLREAEGEDRIVPVGGNYGINEELYWRVHPPRNG
ncbi:MAG: hypothetical protein K8T25_14160 [Planctomycetia bacterium]|nr:hypothetical protein [Planctomycetia bacterium]